MQYQWRDPTTIALRAWFRQPVGKVLTDKQRRVAASKLLAAGYDWPMIEYYIYILND